MAKKNNFQEDMIGFKDFMDDEPQKKTTRAKRDTSSGHELLTFLERESTRLSKVLDLCEEKTFNLKKYPQSDKIVEEIEQSLITARKDVIKRMSAITSPLTKNLNELLNSHFNS